MGNSRWCSASGNALIRWRRTSLPLKRQSRVHFGQNSLSCKWPVDGFFKGCRILLVALLCWDDLHIAVCCGASSTGRNSCHGLDMNEEPLPCSVPTIHAISSGWHQSPSPLRVYLPAISCHISCYVWVYTNIGVGGWHLISVSLFKFQDLRVEKSALLCPVSLMTIH